jgi:hypothetical protein
MKGKIRARSVRETCTDCGCLAPRVEVFVAKNCPKAAQQNLRRISNHSLNESKDILWL